MDTTCRFRVFLTVFVVSCLMSADVLCTPIASSDCYGGICTSDKAVKKTIDDSCESVDDCQDCVTECRQCKSSKQITACIDCMNKQCPTTATSLIDSSTPVVMITRLAKQTAAASTITTTTTTESMDTTTPQTISRNLTTEPGRRSSTTGPSLSKQIPLTGDKEANTDSEESKFIHVNKDFIIGMVVGASAVGILVIAISITCFVCYSRNKRIRKDIIQSYEKKYEKEGRIGMIGNEVYSGASLRGGFLSASASTLRTSVSPNACYAEVEDDCTSDSGKRMSHCSLPDAMETVVDPTSGYAFYKADRPSVYAGFHGNNKRAKNASHGLHRIDRPTLYSGLKRDTNNRQYEENIVLSERVYAEAQEVLPERVLKENTSNKNDQTDPLHTYMKIDDGDTNGPSTSVEIRPSAPPTHLDQSDTLPSALPLYFQVNNENENHNYQMLEKNNESKEDVEDFSEPSEYQSLGETISGSVDNQPPTYFILES